MIGGHRIADDEQGFGVFDARYGAWLQGEVIEERWLGNVGGFWPCIDFANRGLNRIPQRGFLRKTAVLILKRGGVKGNGEQGFDLIVGWPNVFEQHRHTFRIHAQRLGGQVNIHASCQRVCQNQRRRSQEIRFDVRLNPCFKIAIAREHRCGDELIVHNAFGDFRRELARIANTGGAAVGHHLKTELV